MFHVLPKHVGVKILSFLYILCMCKCLLFNNKKHNKLTQNTSIKLKTSLELRVYDAYEIYRESSNKNNACYQDVV